MIIKYLFVILSILFLSCDNTEHMKKDKKIFEEKENEHVIKNIRYLKDNKTGLCFAYYWGGFANGGPALTLVPEEKIPKELLIEIK